MFAILGTVTKTSFHQWDTCFVLLFLKFNVSLDFGISLIFVNNQSVSVVYCSLYILPIFPLECTFLLTCKRFLYIKGSRPLSIAYVENTLPYWPLVFQFHLGCLFHTEVFNLLHLNLLILLFLAFVVILLKGLLQFQFYA